MNGTTNETPIPSTKWQANNRRSSGVRSNCRSALVICRVAPARDSSRGALVTPAADPEQSEHEAEHRGSHDQPHPHPRTREEHAHELDEPESQDQGGAQIG